MDVLEKYGIKIPNTVLVEGMTQSEIVDEVIDFLKQYGSISKTELITEQLFIVEFSSSLAVAALRQILPYTYVSEDSKVSYEISELATICTAAVGILKTNTYLSELQHLAKVTGQEYREVLKGAMSQLGHSIKELSPALVEVKTPLEDSESVSAGLSSAPLPPAVTAAESLKGTDPNIVFPKSDPTVRLTTGS